MRKYLTKERVLFVIAICVIVLGLTSCSGDGSRTTPLNLWKEENVSVYLLDNLIFLFKLN